MLQPAANEKQCTVAHSSTTAFTSSKLYYRLFAGIMATFASQDMEVIQDFVNNGWMKIFWCFDCSHIQDASGDLFYSLHWGVCRHTIITRLHKYMCNNYLWLDLVQPSSVNLVSPYSAVVIRSVNVVWLVCQLLFSEAHVQRFVISAGQVYLLESLD